MDQRYEVGLSFIGHNVDVIYDPADMSELVIESEGHKPWKARPLVIGERTGKRPKLPEHMSTQPAESSRLLTAAEQKHKLRNQQQAPAVSYRAVWKETEQDV